MVAGVVSLAWSGTRAASGWETILASPACISFKTAPGFCCCCCCCCCCSNATDSVLVVVAAGAAAAGILMLLVVVVVVVAVFAVVDGVDWPLRSLGGLVVLPLFSSCCLANSSALTFS